MILSQIFSKILSSLRRPSKEPILPLFSAGFLVGIFFFSSCASTKHVETIPLETLRHDTLYINKEHYDSIYITRTSDTDRTRDTITITKNNTEYRFRFLRDTIYKTRIDSIPYEVTVIETKEIKRPLTWFDKISRAITIAIAIALLAYLGYKTRNLLLNVLKVLR